MNATVTEISGQMTSRIINNEWWVMLEPKLELTNADGTKEVYYQASGVSADCERYIDVHGLHTAESAANFVKAVLFQRGEYEF